MPRYSWLLESLVALPTCECLVPVSHLFMSRYSWLFESLVALVYGCGFTRLPSPPVNVSASPPVNALCLFYI
jgi:hypothetical protein